MKRKNKIYIFWVLLPLMVAGCHVQPLLTPSDVSCAMPLKIQVTGTDHALTYAFRQRLTLDLMPYVGQLPKGYTLQVALDNQISDATYSADASVTRASLTLTARYTLKDATGCEVRKDSIFALNSYSQSQAEYPSIMARDKAIERAVGILAQDLAREVAVTLIPKSL